MSAMEKAVITLSKYVATCRSMFMASCIMLSSSVPAVAVTDHSGTWHAVQAKSRWSSGDMPAGFTLAITLTFADDRIKYHSANTTPGFSLPTLDFNASLDGAVTTVTGPFRFNQISVRRLDDGTLEMLEMKDGDVIVGSFWTFGSDGRSFVRRGVGKGPDGRSKAFEEFFQREPVK
jgi:hypothetical protein